MEIPAGYKSEPAQRVYRVLTEVLGRDRGIKIGDVLCAQGGWGDDLMDEVDYVDYMGLLEKEFDIMIPGEGAENLKDKTVGELVEYMEGRVETPAATS